MKEVYQSFDGKIFENQGACIRYEENHLFEMMGLNEYVFFFDEDFRLIHLTNESVYHDLGIAKYVFISNTNSARALKDYFRAYDISSPDDAGWFAFDVREGWLDWNEYQEQRHTSLKIELLNTLHSLSDALMFAEREVKNDKETIN